MVLNRVDLVYTVNFPISMKFFTFNVIPPATFHWVVEMRAVD
jgi:hypothetical protein